MKLKLIFILVLVVIVAIVGAIFTGILHKQTVAPSTTSTSTPPEVLTSKAVSNAFKKQIENANKITLYDTVIVMPYALQNWGDTNKGGQALLEYESSTGWTLINMGGGAWDAASLEEEGVPADTAQQLVSL